MWGVDFLKLMNKYMELIDGQLILIGFLPPHTHPGVDLRVNLRSISHRYRLFKVAFVRGLTKQTIHLPLGCLQGSIGVPEGGPPPETEEDKLDKKVRF